MTAPDPDVPRFVYPLAVVAGVFYTGVAYVLASFVGRTFDSWTRGPSFLAIVTFAAAHLLVGGLFGLLWPERTWRWGVWLCVVPVCSVALFEPEFPIFLWVSGTTLAPACAGAYAAARVHLKYVESE